MNIGSVPPVDPRDLPRCAQLRTPFQLPILLSGGNSQPKEQRADSHFAEIVSSAEDAIISKDTDGVIQTWNLAAERIFGYRADEVVGRSVLLLIPSDLQHEESAILQHIRSGERIENYETRRVRKNGDEFTASVTISPIRNRRGEVTGASKIVRDVTESRQAEQVRIRNEKLATTSRMASVIAHQINNPLEALVNLIYLAQQRSTDEITSLYLAQAQQELRRISHITQQSMGVYHDPEIRSVLYARDLFFYALSIYESRVQGSRIEIEQNFLATRQVYVRRGELLQAISAVLTNAIDAMPFGGRLILSSRDLDIASVEGVELLVRDTGMGISKEHSKRLFEPFFTTKGTLGAGTGLWIAKQFVDKHGGQISIESRTDLGSSGTTVRIFLPKAG